MDFFQKLSAVWSNIGLVQRALLIAIILTFVIAGSLLSRWAGRPDMGLLYSSLDPEEAGKITDKISEQNIPYELRNGGTSIYAPRDNILQLRLDMAKEGLPADGQSGYSIFDNEKIGISPFVQNVNLNRALQDELAKSIQMIDGVEHARVHLVGTKDKLFVSKTSDTTAAVVLRLRAGYRLSSVSVAAITHLVAGSVAGLESESVTIVDSQGHLLSRHTDQVTDGGAGTVQDYRERVEQNLAQKAENILALALGPGRASVKVSAVINMTSINSVTENYPGKGLPKREETKEQKDTAPQIAAEPGGQPRSGGQKTENETITEFIYAKTVETRVDLPGEIISLSVAALVDLSPPDANGADAGAQSEPVMALADVEEIIKNALGLKDTDSLKVVEARFNRPLKSLIDEETKAGGLDFVAIAGQASLGIMAVCALLALKLFSGATKKAGATAAATPRQLSGGQGPAGSLPAGGAGAGVLRKQIAGALQSNPEQVKQLFASWIQEKEG